HLVFFDFSSPGVCSLWHPVFLDSSSPIWGLVFPPTPCVYTSYSLSHCTLEYTTCLHLATIAPAVHIWPRVLQASWVPNTEYLQPPYYHKSSAVPIAYPKCRERTLIPFRRCLYLM